MSSSQPQSPQSPQSTATNDANEWDCTLDENTGRVYYYNVKTRVTQWEPPEFFETTADPPPPPPPTVLINATAETMRPMNPPTASIAVTTPPRIASRRTRPNNNSSPRRMSLDEIRVLPASMIKMKIRELGTEPNNYSDLVEKEDLVHLYDIKAREVFSNSNINSNENQSTFQRPDWLEEEEEEQEPEDYPVAVGQPVLAPRRPPSQSATATSATTMPRQAVEEDYRGDSLPRESLRDERDPKQVIVDFGLAPTMTSTSEGSGSGEHQERAGAGAAASKKNICGCQMSRRYQWLCICLAALLFLAIATVIPVLLLTSTNTNKKGDANAASGEDNQNNTLTGDNEYGTDFNVTTTVVDALTLLDCRDLTGDLTLLEQGNGTAVLNLKHSSDLCVLVRTDGESRWIPVAKSYGGQPWEPYITNNLPSTTIECNADEAYCTIPLVLNDAPVRRHRLLKALPKLSYALSAQEYDLSPRDAYARFLEQTTFGTRRDDINALMNQDPTASTATMANWVHNQVYNVPPSFHRVFLREHSVSRFESSSEAGRVTHPCQKNAAYRRFVFVEKHKGQDVEFFTLGPVRLVRVNNVVLTILSGGEAIRFEDDKSVVFGDGSYTICEEPATYLGGKVSLRHDNGECGSVIFGPYIGNPPVEFPVSMGGMIQVDLPDNAVRPLDSEFFSSKDPSTQRLLLTQKLEDSVCSTTLDYKTGGPIPVVIGRLDGNHWLHDPRFVLQENTLEKPLVDGGGNVVDETKSPFEEKYEALCANVPRSFQNQESCYLSDHPNVCGESLNDRLDLTLDEEVLKLFYNLTLSTGNPRYVYALDGLRIEDDPEAPPPCQPLVRSRWVPVEGINAARWCNVNSIQAQTLDVLSYLLTNFGEKTDYVRDIFFPGRSDAKCHGADTLKKGYQVFADGVCWRNVHPDHHQVFDMTIWLNFHPGGPARIAKWAENGSPFLSFPASHELNRWQQNKKLFYDIGKLGESIDFSDLSEELQTSRPVLEHFFGTGDSTSAALNSAIVVCGSPGEVANDLSKDGETLRGSFDVHTRFDDDADTNTRDAREVVWTRMAVHAPDQLRQRVAWALSQLLVVNIPTNQAESFTNFYDIFVRHAFGNYRDVLKEVSFSGLMARMLTFLDSKSTAYRWIRSLVLEHPDENFAREIMQLFSIGLYELNDDGTQKLDPNGNPIRTYSNAEIVEYSRAWTGFRENKNRGNLNAERNSIDPMYIRMDYRDVFPKLGLGGRYIGHGYPLCADLPDKHFLLKGAKYILLGSNPVPETQEDPSRWAIDPEATRFVADPSGQLNAVLCGKSSSGSACTYPPTVELPFNIPCQRNECNDNSQSVRMVQVEGGYYYEYIQPACVHQAFVAEPQKIKSLRHYLCADPRVESASTACCYKEDLDRTMSYAHPSEEWWGQRVKPLVANVICSTGSDHIDVFSSKYDYTMCTEPYTLRLKECVSSQCIDRSSMPYYWWSQNSTCGIKAKIHNYNGNVALVHLDPAEDPEYANPLVAKDTKSFFYVKWSNEQGVDNLILNCDSSSGCVTEADGHCLCDTLVTDNQAFDSAPTKEQVLSLPFGSFHPTVVLQSISTKTEAGVRIHADTIRHGWFSEYTIFEVTDDNGVVQWRRNLHSTVSIPGTSLSFPNPVQFVGLYDPAARDGLYETDATLDHYMYHKNTGPFLSTHLAKRFGLSNPTPRLIKDMTKAFRTGRFRYNDLTFGQGTYGDLGATVAALILSDETRSFALDRDPSFGALKEPLIKVVGFLRQMEFQPTPDFPFTRFYADLQERIGQMVYNAPTVFSFFLAEFQPGGVVSDAGLVSPEAEVLTPENVFATMNGIIAASKYGLDRCYDGFGETPNYNENGGYRNCRNRIPGNFDDSSSYPAFEPADTSSTRAIIDELATIMTSGRLSQADRELITDAISNETDSSQILIQAQQLISGSSAFHTTGTVRKTGEARPKRVSKPSSDRKYKAVVVLMLSGGVDSWNLLVPAQCSGTNPIGLNVLEQYVSERGEIGLTASERTLTIDANGPQQQPCQKFAVHPQLPLLKDLYEQNDLSFFLNTGVINKEANKDNYQSATKTQLFSHNSMLREAQVIDPFMDFKDARKSGILGRISHVLNADEYSFQAQTIGISNKFPALEGDVSNAPPPLIMSSRGPKPFSSNKPSDEEFEPQEFLMQLNDENHVASSVFGETWSSAFAGAMDDNDFFSEILDDIELKEECGLRHFEMVVKMMETRTERNADRDLIILNYGGWDDHSDLKDKLEKRFERLNKYLECFVNNVKDKGLWDQVVLLTASEFARTMTPNTNAGSDHAWGGHYFALGGGVKGGQMFGQYPSDITDNGPLMVGRGRSIPKLSWDSIWTSFAEWLGVQPKDFDYVVPNADQTGSPVLRKDDVFE